MPRISELQKVLQNKLPYGNIVPDNPLAFLTENNLQETKAIVIGQDPYPYTCYLNNKPLSNGHAFCTDCPKEPVSLFYLKEAFRRASRGKGIDLGHLDNNLMPLRKKGIVFMNMYWTTILSKSLAHTGYITYQNKKLDYQYLTYLAIKLMQKESFYGNIRILALGQHARYIRQYIDGVESTYHPAALHHKKKISLDIKLFSWIL